MRALRLALAGLTLAAVSHGAGGTAPVWLTDWNQAFQLARSQRRLVFVDYTSNACKPCQDIETVSFHQPEVLQRLSDFVLLRVDVVRNQLPADHREYNPPVFLVFDPAGHERFRINSRNLGAIYPAGWGRTPKGDAETFDRFRAAAPAFLQAWELSEGNQQLKAAFLVANTDARLRMDEEARRAYAEARRVAEESGDRATAQLAEVQSAFTFAHSDDSAKALRLLDDLSKTPVNAENEAIIWLTLGHVHEARHERELALAAYEHARSVAASDSRAGIEAARASERLQQ